MLANPNDKPILSDRTQTQTRLKLEQRFQKILVRELLTKTKTADPKAIPQIIKQTTAANIWGLWLAGIKHGSEHGLLELRMVRGLSIKDKVGRMKFGDKSNSLSERLDRVQSGSSLYTSSFILYTSPRLANFALLDEDPPSKLQNKRAQDAIWTRVNTLAGNVADTEWAKIQGSLEENVKGDSSRSQLQAAINDTLGSKSFAGRAEAIARTELTFAYNAGRIETYRANNVEAIRRYCIVDERTCEQCAGLNGMVARLDDAAACMRIFAPSHTNCLIPSTPVSTGSVKATSQRHYNGEVVRIETACGNVLTVTPNHPVLTPQGWVAANLLNEGSDVISGASLERIASVIAPNDYECNTAIEEIVTAFDEANRSTSISMETAPENFHGDGQGSKIHVINTDRLLGNEIDIPVFNEFNKLDLIRTFTRKSFGLNSVRFINQKLPSLVSTSSGSMGFSNLSGSSFSSHLCPFHFLRSRLASAFSATMFEDSLHSSSRNSEFLSAEILGQSSQISSDRVVPDCIMPFLEGLRSKQAPRNQSLFEPIGGDFGDTSGLLQSLAGNIKLDRVVKISRFRHDGFVYNIETDTGWYFASNIITHNCRCTVSPVINIRQLAEANRQPPPLAEEPWLVGRIIAAIIGG